MYRAAPVQRIFCIGRNYAAMGEMAKDRDREPPFFFLEPTNAVVESDMAAS